MAQVTPLLVELGAYDGLVALAVAKAKALDPESVATQRSEAGTEARLVSLLLLPVLCFLVTVLPKAHIKAASSIAVSLPLTCAESPCM